ncbi:MAG: RluA family pseudouridine synthase [Oscillospiraceae bacterium]|nr:RluA family pseudouridine synthase [Candidatus Equicaccousia limihippi]
MLEFTVQKNDANMRLDKLLRRLMPTLPDSLMYKYLRTKKIKVNKKRAEISYKTVEGDVISCYVPDEFAAAKPKNYDFMSSPAKLDIVFEDQNLILLNKPQGLLCHPDKNEYGDTLLFRFQRYLFEKGEYDPENEQSFKPALCNRIDRNTCGIVIAAKNAESLKILCDKIKAREIDKRYLTAVHGKPPKNKDVITSYLFKDSDKNKVYIENRKTEQNRTIKTGYEVLTHKNGLSLLEIRLYTGRTHQIRAQMAKLGCPIVGDGKYGKLKFRDINRQCLCSYKLTFEFTTDAGILNYLNKKSFEVDDIWFKKELFGGNI